MSNNIVDSIIANYAYELPLVKENIAKFLQNGSLSDTGKLLIYAVDQGFEHGPIVSFASNPDAYDPCYHYELAMETNMSGFAAPLGMLECIASECPPKIPTILKINSANTLDPAHNNSLHANLAITANVEDALRLQCCAIGFSIYPGSHNAFALFEQLSYISAAAKRNGLAVVVWAYPRGNMSDKGETALDIISYSAHMACLLGAHIIKVKIPSAYLEKAASKHLLSYMDLNNLTERLKHIRQACFNGKRILIFSGNSFKEEELLLEEILAIKNANCNGSIIGRNIFKRSRSEAVNLVKKIINIYKNN